MSGPHFGPELQANDRLCSYSPDLSPSTCRAPAAHHVVMIDEEGDLMHGWACERHLAVAVRVPHEAHHEVGADCGMPGSLFYNPPNCCRCPDGTRVVSMPETAAATRCTCEPHERYVGAMVQETDGDPECPRHGEASW